MPRSCWIAIARRCRRSRRDAGARAARSSKPWPRAGRPLPTPRAASPGRRWRSSGLRTVDHHRALRQGFPEVVFGEGKTPEQILGIAGRLAERRRRLPGDARWLRRPVGSSATSSPTSSGTSSPGVRTSPPPSRVPSPCAARCSSSPRGPATSRWPRRPRSPRDALGNPVERLTDVGVAGHPPHPRRIGRPLGAPRS